MLGRGEIKEVLAKFDMSPSRALGQNFLCDPNVARKIANLASISGSDSVLEIGPGIGSLTVVLAEKAHDVVAIELDRYVIPALEDVLARNACTNVKVIYGDAMKFDYDAVLDNTCHWKLVANLPYNISTPLVITMLERYQIISEMVVMVQREVGERMCAKPGGSLFSGVALKIGYFADTKVVASVSREVFMPKPNVDSVLVHIVRRDSSELDLDEELYERLFSLSRLAFANRRQMIRRTLVRYISESSLKVIGIDPTRRPETLTLEQWKLIAQRVAEDGN